MTNVGFSVSFEDLVIPVREKELEENSVMVLFANLNDIIQAYKHQSFVLTNLHKII